MPDYSEFYDPRLVAIYDAVCPIDGYRGFYEGLATELHATSIVDIGCGSGLLTCALAERGHQVIGVEPAPLMLDLARRRDTEGKVRWVAGGIDQLREWQAILAILTGHVAQFFLEDEAWSAALSAIHAALASGGHLAFESRNPAVQPWRDGIASYLDWPTFGSPKRIDHPTAGRVEWWGTLLEVNGERVRNRIHYRFESGEELVSDGELKFRSLTDLTQSLRDAGFLVENVFGDWDRQAVAADSPELIVVAARA